MKEENKNMPSGVKACFEEVIVLNEGSSNYYLQKESKEWGNLKDVTGYIQDTAQVHLRLLLANQSINPYLCSDYRGRDLLIDLLSGLIFMYVDVQSHWKSQ